VKSVLASLWSINDAATVTLVKKFYAEWYQNRVSKAEALATAQQTLISSRKYAHPYYWAPFILVGNWL
jgi:CHAT domain-containing protein